MKTAGYRRNYGPLLTSSYRTLSPLPHMKGMMIQSVHISRKWVSNHFLSREEEVENRYADRSRRKRCLFFLLPPRNTMDLKEIMALIDGLGAG